MNPILAAPAAAIGALALAPRALELAAAPVGFLSALRQAVGPEARQTTTAPNETSSAEAETPRTLRRKLEADPDHPRYLLTERGIGYRLTSGTSVASQA